MTSSTPSAPNTRRDFLKTSTAALATASLPYWFTSATPAEAAYRSANERPVVGCIGTGSRWGGVGPQAMRFGDVAAVCDVDTAHAKRGQDRVKRTQKKDGKGNRPSTSTETTARSWIGKTSTSSPSSRPITGTRKLPSKR
ncbi:MAG: hypothetical protein CM1200mP2_58680 [Planctomycetaceae bacterium]|nr:MAG: hypothetical protein CM1200mP2_58680 [Planctomycetaceae bacterium]